MLVVTAAISFVGASGDFLGEWQKLYQKTTAMAVDGNRKRVQYEFLPRDAMLARYLLLSQLCRSVRPSVTSRHSIETTGRIELVLAWRLLSTCPTLCYEETCTV